MLAAIRPSDWNLPLLVHVAGAMLLVGALVLVAAALVRASGRGEPRDTAAFTRLGFRTLLLMALPAWLAMRVGGEWIASKEGGGESAWIGIGYTTADFGLLLLLATTVLAGLASRRQRSSPSAPGALGRVATGLTLLLLVAYVVTIWAMTTKPG
jgi:hypothetical protein